MYTTTDLAAVRRMSYEKARKLALLRTSGYRTGKASKLREQQLQDDINLLVLIEAQINKATP